MKALVYARPLTMAIQDIPEPVAEPGEVIVDVRAAGICGSELEGFATQNPFRVPPLVMGHEFAGVRVEDGKKVVVNPMVSCHNCDMCHRGLVNLCRVRKIIGIHRAGGFAERVAVPAANCVEVRDEVPFTTLALTEPMANAAHALRLVQAHDPWPQRIGIIGCGMVGLAAGILARHRGVPEVVICDRSAARLASAERLGLTVAGATLAGEFDAIYDSVGSAATRAASVEQIRPGGTALWAGLHEAQADLDSLAMIGNEKRILATFCYDQTDFEAATRLVETMSPDFVATCPLDEGVEGFMALLDGPADAVKTILVR
ncbi:galactitol-1-phosphate 5-dehydrogenase [Micromonospora sonchi]|uniref:Galactitol-1-phosphate 5-dehydrogenase n=1 Tax=Micromonospora sonchi TaxID=1763543 RepID=A0A917X568_9ACTN|nr:alcohol dehydrogenase catalytic domain-containing protein [Micromonospora sonchi]GGM65922.1 galactitol-1-phosphate 5-dehydrogenase [Micromonospora sonchi]